ncbi:MAG: flagellar basal body L-ring protein FlgH [Helicobacteraceae bacterium]|nr:flagellar basal body L-ring protein FlgH [Helicobacteraceae bacterium]
MKHCLFIITVFFSLAGCSKVLNSQIDFKPPEYVQQMESREEEQLNTLGSLFGKGENPLFSDRKAMNVNDVVTVLIEERASSSSSGNRALNRSQESAYTPGVMTYGGSAKAGEKIARNVNSAVGFGFSNNSESTFSGGGTATRSENFTTTVSARIVKVLQNGNYFIEGRREILVQDEKQIIQLSGVIRPYDIAQNNTINSAYISDAKISYKTEGVIHRNSEQGWGSQLIDAIWPF